MVRFLQRPKILIVYLLLFKVGLTQVCNDSYIKYRPTPLVSVAQYVSFKVPLVVHVLWNTGVENIRDTNILNQIEQLNSLFWYCPDTVRAEFAGVVACPSIFFELQKTNIARYYTRVTSFNLGQELFVHDFPKYAAYGGADATNTDKYLNIWVCNLDPTNLNPKSLLGYAFPPNLANDWDASVYVGADRQGVVINYRCFLDSQYFNILAHEIGHYLGLRHVWGNAEENCESDDGIDDTPLSATPSYTCDYTKNTCNTGADDMPDMVENIMDYSPAGCGKYFTYGQVERMVSNLVHLRPNLYVAEVGQNEHAILEVFPNPSFGRFTVFLHAKEAPNSTIEIYDIAGRRVYKEVFSGKKQLVEIPPVYYRKGMYIIRLHNQKYCITRKVLFLDQS